MINLLFKFSAGPTNIRHGPWSWYLVMVHDHDLQSVLCVVRSLASDRVRDGQTNGIKFIPFVCPSSIPTTTQLARLGSVFETARHGIKITYPIRLSVIYPYNHSHRAPALARLGSMIETDRRMG
jgi:hypothetical protein